MSTFPALAPRLRGSLHRVQHDPVTRVSALRRQVEDLACGRSCPASLVEVRT